ncbi:MAG: ketopantoate reductase family protein [Lautropia sp.]
MKIGIIGAGAIGGLVGVRLAAAGHAVSVLARGEALAAIRANGWRLTSEGRTQQVAVDASDRAEALGPQELLVVAVKAPAFASVLPAITAMSSTSTLVVPALNGVPWWFDAARSLDAVDPGGAIAAAIDRRSVVGCVVYPACSTPEPGHTLHASGNRIVFGAVPLPDAASDPTQAAGVAACFADAGFDARESADIRFEVWHKLLGNACFNPVSLLVRASTDHLIDDPRVNALFVAMMKELLALGAALGVRLEVDPLDRLAMTRALGRVRTSMLQDAERGRAIELDAILGAVVELADARRIAIPTLAGVYALARLHAHHAGLLPDR